MDKRAMSDVMIVLIIFIVGALVLITFGYSIANQLKEDSDSEICRLSVLAQSQFRKVPGIDISLPKTVIPLDCPRRRLKISENKVLINGKKSDKYNFKKLTQDEVNHILAEELRMCWNKMGEGKLDVFEYSWFVDLKSICVVCSELEFDDKLKPKGQSYEGLLDYLKTKKMPKSEIKYSDYLVRTQASRYHLGIPYTQYNPWNYGSTDKIYEDKLLTSEKYSIYFLAWKSDVLNKAIGAYTPAYFIGLGKEDKLSIDCQQIVNN
ncbi:hypothetical protein HYX00_05520 [Candidatus Woesearchaeota archaeon]|nr:hypothetical protein [Candidatus Woesearchaeota archaeon]